MDATTIQRLNAINRDFYQTTASEFDQTRGRAWQGWLKLRESLQQPLSVLDVGCGNGRFGLFLAETFTHEIQYHGIDNNPALLQYAQQDLGAIPHLQSRLEFYDVVEGQLPDERYDLVVLFGVIHHVPSAVHRLDFLKRLAERVTDSGLLCFAAWRFYEYPRFVERLVPFPEDLVVESGDYLLDWRRGEHALRYCHYVDDAEHQQLIEATGMQEISTYRADGADDRMNRYSILKRRL